MKKYSKIVKASLFILSLLIIGLAFYGVLWSDDFTFIKTWNSKDGLIDYLIGQYMGWDGRFMSIQGVTQILLIVFVPPSIGLLVWVFCFFYFTVFLTRIIDIETGVFSHFQSRGFDKIHTCLMFFVLIWFGNKFHLYDTVYWVTGGIYAMSLAFSFGFIWFVLKNGFKKGRVLTVIGFLISIIVGLSGANITFALVVFLLIHYFPEWYKSEKIMRKFIFTRWFIWSLGVVISTLFIIVAPGNFIRASFSSMGSEISIMSTIYNLFEIFARYVYYSYPILFLGVFLLLYLSSSLSILRLVKSYMPDFSKDLLYNLNKYKWFLVGASSIIPLLVVPENSGRRTAVFFINMMFLFVMSNGLMGFVGKCEKNVNITIRAFYRIVFYLFLFIAFLVLIYHHVLSFNIYNQIKERELFLLKNKGVVEEIYVKPILVPRIPFSFKFHDKLHKPYADYYGYDTIKLDTVGLDGLPYYYITPP
jgi:hypothetical protein